MRILLVEDEPSAARFIAKGLREASHAVDVASDGTAAAERCQQNDYDAVILDVMLPGKDGLTVCRDLRAGGSNVPIHNANLLVASLVARTAEVGSSEWELAGRAVSWREQNPHVAKIAFTSPLNCPGSTGSMGLAPSTGPRRSPGIGC